MKQIPLGYLDSAGARAGTTVPLLWFLLLVSIAVCVIIAALLWASVRRRTRQGTGEADSLRVQRESGGVRLVLIGTGISTVVLLIAVGWTMAALAQVARMPTNAPLQIDVTAHQWWWQIDYKSPIPSQMFTTANEIHIPVGRKVLVRLHGVDVIHSFWVPKLTGKTDVIPGQENVAWMEADRPGMFRGQCSEYCGLQHAHMAFEVIAEPAPQFAAWWAHQLQTAPPPITPAQQQGMAIVEYRCSVCHALRGTDAHSNFAPDLTHLASRQTIAAGTLPNNPAALGGWIEDPQAIKPGAKMPPQHLSGPGLQALLSYVETLK